MKPHIKKLWVDALRSGKYKQGRERLCSAENEFCCLGVLCDIYIKKAKKGNIKWGNTETSLGTKCKMIFNDECELPEKIQLWAGLQTSVGHFILEKVKSKTKYQSLVDMNDSGLSFKQIANFIEKHF